MVCSTRSLRVGSGIAVSRPSLPRVALAQPKPDKLVFVGDNGPWHWCLVEEVAPAFEKLHGIKVDFTLLPIDALSARLKAELNSGSVGISAMTSVWPRSARCARLVYVPKHWCNRS